MDLKTKGILFDKDGTLFDFSGSWAPWYADLLLTLAKTRQGADQLAQTVHFDMETGRFGGESVLIHGTLEEFLDRIMPLIPNWQRHDLKNFVLSESQHVPQVPVLPLAPLLDGFLEAEFLLGIATNDNEAPTLAQLSNAGILDRFSFVAGSDSGFGAKPGIGMQQGFCKASGLDPANVLMIGDSAHDMISGRNAGMQTIAVLTGVASRADLEPLADVVLNDIGELPEWLAG